MTFSHLDNEQRPTMVDVTEKSATKRSAVAEARVRFPPAVAAALQFKSGAKNPAYAPCSNKWRDLIADVAA